MDTLANDAKLGRIVGWNRRKPYSTIARGVCSDLATYRILWWNTLRYSTLQFTAIKLSDVVGRIRRQPSSDITQLKLEPSDLRRMTAKALSALQDGVNP